MFKVVLDTNVIISALNFGGKPAQVLVLTRKQIITNFISKPILQEITGVLQRSFNWQREQTKNIFDELLSFSTLVTPTNKIDVVSDPDDNKFLECAIEGQADFIVSGDHHLKDLKTFKNIQIMDPATFLEYYANHYKS